MAIQDAITSHSVFPKDALTAQSAVGELKQAKWLRELGLRFLQCLNQPRDRMGPLHFIMYLNLGEITTDSCGNLKEVSSTRINSAW